MGEPEHARLEELFDAVMDMTPEEQAAYLERACADDERMHAQLRSLLAADRVSSSLDSPVPGLTMTEERAAAPAPASSSDGAIPQPGARIKQYEIIRELGRGGMGAVFLARDTKLARRVAIKFLASTSRRFTERFLVEARATARCTHENIVVIHEVDEYGDTPYMVLEYVQGRPLSRLLEDRPMPPRRALELMVPVARALAYAHQQGIVHRDLKPDNIIVTDAGTIKVLDFGIAKLRTPHPAVESRPTSTNQEVGADGSVGPSREVLQVPGLTTNPGTLLGTLPYMSPEQWRGGDAVDHQSDLWAIGIMLYEMVIGHHPLRPQHGEDLAVVHELDVVMPRVRDSGVDVPEELARIIDSCLQKRTAERVQSARELLDALEPMIEYRSDASARARRDARESADDDNPYPGLLCFREVDAHRYFGRSREIANTLARLRERPLIGVTGPTGIGKSSFVRAGILPALRASGELWESHILRPGRDPLAALVQLLVPLISSGPGDAGVAGEPGEPGEPGDPGESNDNETRARATLTRRVRAEPGYLGALLRKRARKRGCRILLVVDPFEELYTLSADDDERHAFMSCLVGAADDPAAPVRVLISIRSDFLDRVAEHGFFMGELTGGLMFLPSPSRDSLREALTYPAHMAGYRFESRAMVERIIDEVATTEGSLPLLQFAAGELWHGRDREQRLLTEARYHDIGGIVGALSRHADEVVRTLGHVSPQGSAIVQAVLRRLVTKERTRALASMSDLRQLSDDPADVQRIIDRLVDARLLLVHTSEDASGATVELIHDSLIHSWRKLSRWLDESADDAAFLEQVRTAATHWNSKGRPPGLLWRGETMDEARRWHRRYRGALSKLERQYLDATFALAHRATRIKRLLIVGTMGFLGLLATAAVIALIMIRDAEHEAKDRATSEQLVRRELETQLHNLQAEKRERQQAETRAQGLSEHARETRGALDRTEIELRDNLRALQATNTRLQEESARARRLQRAAEDARARAEAQAIRAREAAQAERLAKRQLNEKLEQERMRLHEIERKVGDISRTLE